MPIASGHKWTGDEALGRALATTGDGFTVQGKSAEDAAVPDTRYPNMMGGIAKEQDGTDPGSVSAEDDAVVAAFDRNRRQFVNIAHPNLWRAATFQQIASPTGTPVLKAAPGANLSLYLTDLIVSVTGTAGDIEFFEDITAGTPTSVIEKLYLGTDNPFTKEFITPLKLTANKDLGFQTNTMGRHSINAAGYIAP